MKTYPKVLCGMLQLLMACGSSEEIGDGAQTAQVGWRQQAGRDLQGRDLQGRDLQGRDLQGASVAVATIEQVQINGQTVANLSLQGTVLTGWLGSQYVAGADFIGATVIQRDVDGQTFNSTIAEVRVDSRDASGEILLYAITAYNSITGSVENVCTTDPYGERWATAVQGSWDNTGARVSGSTAITFACTSGVIAKCMRWGYKPWKSVNGVSLVNYHQSCTRMARADYCGDGISHTQDGTLIDMYDNLQIQQRTPIDPTSPLAFDAAWTPNGAYCMTKVRWLALSQLLTVSTACKLKFRDLWPLVEVSPVDPLDVCGVKRIDLSRNDVRMDNQSGINIALY